MSLSSSVLREATLNGPEVGKSVVLVIGMSRKIVVFVVFA